MWSEEERFIEAEEEEAEDPVPPPVPHFSLSWSVLGVWEQERKSGWLNMRGI